MLLYFISYCITIVSDLQNLTAFTYCGVSKSKLNQSSVKVDTSKYSLCVSISQVMIMDLVDLTLEAASTFNAIALGIDFKECVKPTFIYRY